MAAIINANLDNLYITDEPTNEPEQKPEPYPVAWMESPHGAIRANPLYQITVPQSLVWSIPLYTHLPAASPEPDAIAAKYNELLMAVAQKHPDETRHETALRYITQAENQSNAPDRAKEMK
jgi:hypothetical protein